MCRAQFTPRFPPRLSRTLPLLDPDQTGTGAVPVNRAKASLSRNRWTPAVSPMMRRAGRANDERGREHPAPGDSQQRGREHADQVAQLVLKGSDLLGQVAAAFEQ